MSDRPPQKPPTSKPRSSESPLSAPAGAAAGGVTPGQAEPRSSASGGPAARRFTPPAAVSSASSTSVRRAAGPSAATLHRPHRFSIPRSQIWLFWIMLLLVITMAVYLIRLRERASDRFAAAAQQLPLSIADTHEAPLRLYLASDTDGSLAEKPLLFPLPSDPNARARVVLEKLIAEYAAPGSLHPLNIATGVEEVYLLPLPGQHQVPTRASVAQLAVVNLTTAFVQNHPSGIEPETLTLLSMIATLRANLPQVAQVRFVVDGQQQATLAGHADLTRTYLAAANQMTDEPPAAGSGPGSQAAGPPGGAQPSASPERGLAPGPGRTSPPAAAADSKGVQP